jgi:uncharacterized protein YndB with AHSA1/START domain
MTATITPAPVRKTLRVRAAPARAFDTFTAGMSTWWPAGHSIGTAPLKETVIEPHEGGRWFERGDDGSECDWGRVLAWEPPSRVLLAWQLDAQWRYDPDLVTEVEVRFIAEPDGMTRVEFEHRNLERLGPSAADARGALDSEGGWTGLLERFRGVAEVAA